jgi:hypothetical protein
MQLLAPEILEEARQLSPTLTGAGLFLGLLLWIFGGRSHRFWLALLITLSAGLLGLSYGQAVGTQPLVAGLLLAVSAGALALSLVRILVFAAGGIAALGLVQVIAPSWDEPILVFLLGGLCGVLLYRFWITTFAAFLGTLLMGYCSLALLDHFGKLDSPAWAQKNAPLLSWACACVTSLGVLVQILFDRRRKAAARAAAAGEPERPGVIALCREWGQKLLQKAG